MFSFQHIEYLIALAAVPLLYLFYFSIINWKKKAAAKIGDKQLVQALIKNYSPRRFYFKFIVIAIAFASAIIALANLRSNNGSEKITRRGTDVMIALDVSKSMLAQDVKPDRLERAKKILGKLIDKLDNDRIGLVIFAGRAYLQMPLTVDHEAAKMFIGSVTPEAVPTQGTVIADALQMCASAFDTKEKKYKSVILISDGEDHDDKASKVATQMAGEGIVIHTIGIGSPGGTTIIDPSTGEVKEDEDGNAVITRLNEKELIALAEKGKGLYQLYNNTDEVVAKLKAQLNTMDQRVFAENSSANYKNYFQFFLIITLLLLIAELLIPEIRKNVNTNAVIKNKVTLNKALFLLISIAIPSFLYAQADKSLIKKGNEAYTKNEYGKAIENYKAAADKNPGNTVAQYNLGNAFYKNNKSSDAVKAYDDFLQAAVDPVDKAKAYYNKGVVLQNSNKINECIDAYKNALKLLPGDDDARKNLQKALQQQKKQQQQQQNANQQQEQNKPENNTEKEQDKPKDEQQKDSNSPGPEPSRMTRQDAEEKLKALQQQEKNLQDKLRKVNPGSSGRPDKDW